jgi:biopolymer transport protein ExbD
LAGGNSDQQSAISNKQKDDSKYYSDGLSLSGNFFSSSVSNSLRGTRMNKPNINVTPLIDVLLVLLIIFMVVSPLKPSTFKAAVPREPSSIDDTQNNIDTLIVFIHPDLTLNLNKEPNSGTVDDPAPIIDRLRDVFSQRRQNGDISQRDLISPDGDRTEKTVFINAPRNMEYGKVVRVIDSVKQSGAFPISLQIDKLD